MLTFEEFLELARERRTSRGYLEKSISHDAITSILPPVIHG